MKSELYPMYNLNECKLIYIIKNNINISYPLYQYILYYPLYLSAPSNPQLLHYPFLITNPKPFFQCTIFENYKIKKMSNYYKKIQIFHCIF